MGMQELALHGLIAVSTLVIDDCLYHMRSQRPCGFGHRLEGNVTSGAAGGSNKRHEKTNAKHHDHQAKNHQTANHIWSPRCSPHANEHALRCGVIVCLAKHST